MKEMKFELTNKLIKFAKELDFTQVVSCELSEGFYGGKIKYEDEQYFVTFSRQSNEAYKFEGIAPYLNSEDIRNLEELAKEKIKMLSYLVDSFSVVVNYNNNSFSRSYIKNRNGGYNFGVWFVG